MALTVLGSSNLDHVHRVARIPAPGETVLSESYAIFPGGKGLNQAVAAGRTAPGTVFVTALGRDEAAGTLLQFLADEPVSVLARRGAERTGTAQITVDAAGENAIVVDSGANGAFLAPTADESAAVTGSAALLMQLELPLETVTDAAVRASAAGTLVVLNAAPIRPLPVALLEATDVLVVNEHEAKVLADERGEGSEDPVALARALTAAVPLVIVTLGGAGTIVAERGSEPRHSPAFSVEVVDTTGAGDTFCGAFAARLAEGMTDSGSRALPRTEEVLELVRFASAAAAISVGRAGAAVSGPTRTETEAFLRDHGRPGPAPLSR